MGKQSNNRTYKKQVYKRADQRYYIKGNSNIDRKEFIMDWLARIVAMLFYPIYMLLVVIGKLTKSAKKIDWKSLKPLEKIKGKITALFGSGDTKKSHSRSYEQSKKYAKSKSYVYSKKNQKSNLWDKINALRIDRINLGKISLKNINFKGINLKNIDLQNDILPFINRHRYALSYALAGILVLSGGIYALNVIKNSPIKNLANDEGHYVKVSVDSSSDALNADEAKSSEEKTLLERYSFTDIPAYQIKANGKVIANFKHERDAEKLLDELKAMYTENTEVEFIEVYFAEQVEIEKGKVSLIDFNGYDELDSSIEYIVKGTKEEKTHKVQKGENYWIIANYYGINPSDLEKANPTIKPEKIQIGQSISLVVPKPLISVCTVEEATYNTEIPFNVVYESTSNLYKDESKTKVNGVPGKKEVVAKITRQNGRELGRIILQEEVVSNPVDKVVYKGTKAPPPKMGSGILAKPTSRGTVTSEFGWRWGRRHEGIDIGLPTGSDVKAADGGTVTFAGYNSSYGHYIIIDHGGNITTLYAHNSSLLVKKGDKVYKGQLIARSGNSGRSTGPHLHFEVRKNGIPQNPRNYVSY